MAVKVTFTLDEETVRKLRLTAERLKKPKSVIVREAIDSFHRQSDRISEAERLDRIAAMNWYFANVPPRPQEDVDRELAEIRETRRRWGHRHSAE